MDYCRQAIVFPQHISDVLTVSQTALNEHCSSHRIVDPQRYVASVFETSQQDYSKGKGSDKANALVMATAQGNAPLFRQIWDARKDGNRKTSFSKESMGAALIISSACIRNGIFRILHDNCTDSWGKLRFSKSSLAAALISACAAGNEEAFHALWKDRFVEPDSSLYNTESWGMSLFVLAAMGNWNMFESIWDSRSMQCDGVAVVIENRYCGAALVASAAAGQSAIFSEIYSSRERGPCGRNRIERCFIAAAYDVAVLMGQRLFKDKLILVNWMVFVQSTRGLQCHHRKWYLRLLRR